MEEIKTELKINRVAQGSSTTIGQLFFFSRELNDWQFVCYVLEDTLRKTKIKKETAIFDGLHKLSMRKEGRIYERYLAKGLPVQEGLILIECPGFQFTMIHIGNDEDDTEGCPLVGLDYVFENGNFRLLRSTDAFERLMTFYGIPQRIAKGGRSIVVNNSGSLRVWP